MLRPWTNCSLNNSHTERDSADWSNRHQEPTLENAMPEGWTLMQHGLSKALLLLGVSHHHDGDDIVATCGWESMVNALGYTVRNGNLHQMLI